MRYTIQLASVLALLALATPARAADLGLGITPKVGIAVPTSKLGTTPYGALQADYQLPYLEGLVRLGIDFDYSQPIYSATSNDPAVGGDYGYRVRQRIFGTTVLALAHLPVAMVDAFGGVGFGTYYLNAEAKTLGVATTESQWRTGLELRGGAAYRLGPGEVVGEVVYRYVALRFDSTGDSNVGAISLGVGYRLSL